MLAVGLSGAATRPSMAEDAGPAVTVGSVTPDVGAGSVSLADVKIVYPGDDGTAIAIKEIIVKGVDPSASQFAAAKVDIKGLTTTSKMGAKFSLSVDAATLTNVSAPIPSAERFAAGGKPGQLPPLAAWLLSAKAESITIPTMALKTDVEGIVSNAQYKDVVITGVDGGRIASFAVAGASQESSDGAKGSAKLTMGKVAVDQIDFGAYAAWLDDELAAAAPKEKRLLYKSFTVDGVSATSGEGTFEIAKVTGGDVKIGPPSMKPSEFMALIGKMKADPNFADKSPKEMVVFLRGLFGAFEIGNFEATGLKFAEAGKSPGTVGLMRFENFAGTRIGEVRLGDLAFTDDTDGTAIKLGSFAVRGIDVVELDALLDKVAQDQSTDTLPLEQYPKPRITGIALADLDATLPGKGKFTIGGITLDTPDWVGFSPITVKGRVEGLSLPVDAIEDEMSRAQFKALGLDTLTVNSAIDLAWQASEETLAVGPITLDIDGVGKTVIEGGLGGVPRSVFENPETAEQAIATLDFRGLTLSLQDGGSFAKILDMAAEQQGTTRAKLARQTAQQVQGGMIAFLGMDEAAAKVGAALKAFITDPKSLKIVIAAAEPVPAIAFMRVSQGDDEALGLIKKSLKIDASANQ